MPTSSSTTAGEVVSVRRARDQRLAVYTILRGRMIVENGALTGNAGYGQHLTRIAAA